MSSNMHLKNLGFDLLMMIELESELTAVAVATGLDTAALAACMTVGEVEALCSQTGAVVLSSPSSSNEIGACASSAGVGREEIESRSPPSSVDEGRGGGTMTPTD